MTPGWFGKMPSLGDFTSRRLPDEFVHCWDGWLQLALAGARDALGEEDWPARYLVAPIRRFWLAPGIVGDTAWAGLLMPSIDRVGRHFPLTVAAPAGSLAAALAARAWFDALDRAARQVLDVAFTVDDFEQQLAALPAVDFAATPDDAAQQLAALLQPQSESCSVWWHDDATEPARFHCYAALPPPASFAGLLLKDAGDSPTIDA